jgi:hypothetical protein
MSANQQASPRVKTILGACLAAGGLYLLLAGFHVLPLSRESDSVEDVWGPLLIGFIVFLAGASLILQVFGHAGDDGEVAADAPQWLRAAQYILGAAMFAGFAMLASCVALLGEAQSFSGGIPGLGAYNVPLARIIFGLGALVFWLGTVVYVVYAARKLRQGRA